MCCRYCAPAEMSVFMLEKYLNLINDKQSKTGEIYPTDLTNVIVDTSNGIGVTEMKWGFSGGRSPIFNARGESLKEKPMFKSHYHNRCAAFCLEYYEWKDGIKYAVRSKDGSAIFLAGIWRINNQNRKEFTLITIPAANEMLKLHDRTPFALTQNYAECWIKGKDESFVFKGLQNMYYSVV